MSKIFYFSCLACNLEFCIEIEPKYSENEMPEEFKNIEIEPDNYPGCPNCGSENISKD